MKDVLIVGAGPAGLTAAIYAVRAGLSAVVFDKSVYGGQVSLTSEVDNYPGLPNIQGVDFANNLYAHATSQGAEVVFEEVTALELDGTIKRVTTPNRIYEGRTIILANGATRRKLDVPGEAEFTGRGVSYCATCDAAFFRGKSVAIVGGGDTALVDSLFLSNNTEKVYLIHRRDTFRGEKIKQDAVSARKNIEILRSSTIEEILGDNKVHGIRVKTPDGTRTIPVSGVFVAVGLVPETGMYKELFPTNSGGYILSGENCRTPLPGVYVAGDIRHKPLRQIITAASDGAVAAVDAAEYCNDLEDFGVVEEGM